MPSVCPVDLRFRPLVFACGVSAWLLGAMPAVATECDPALPDTAPTERFRDNGDGTVSDRLTKLMWTRCSLGQNPVEPAGCEDNRDWFTQHSWGEAMRNASRSRLGGYDDWRLPTLYELRSLVQRRCSNPAINSEVFPRTLSHFYWTMTGFENNPDYAWRINFRDGGENADLKSSPSYRVRLVRGAPPMTASPQALSGDRVKPTRRSHALDDGIHDPRNPGIAWLQDPDQALAGFERNRWDQVDWMGLLATDRIQPRASLDGQGSMQRLDLDVLYTDTREMNWVRFPHSSHTEWLACENCHPVPFAYKAGQADISMDAILLGEYCGTCHGRVAFSTMLCDRCHSVTPEPAAAASPP